MSDIPPLMQVDFGSRHPPMRPTHTPQQAICKHCGLVCRNLKAVKHHVNKIHSLKIEGYQCGECGHCESLRDKSLFERHLRTTHGLNNPAEDYRVHTEPFSTVLRCHHCPINTFTLAQMTRHLRSHRPNRAASRSAPSTAPNPDTPTAPQATPPVEVYFTNGPPVSQNTESLSGVNNTVSEMETDDLINLLEDCDDLLDKGPCFDDSGLFKVPAPVDPQPNVQDINSLFDMVFSDIDDCLSVPTSTYVVTSSQSNPVIEASKLEVTTATSALPTIMVSSIPYAPQYSTLLPSPLN